MRCRVGSCSLQIEPVVKLLKNTRRIVMGTESDDWKVTGNWTLRTVFYLAGYLFIYLYIYFIPNSGTHGRRVRRGSDSAGSLEHSGCTWVRSRRPCTNTGPSTDCTSCSANPRRDSHTLTQRNRYKLYLIDVWWTSLSATYSQTRPRTV